MTGSRLHVHLFRDSFNTPWGFRLQGGKDLSQALTVQRVFSNSPAEGELQRGDAILAIGGEDTTHLTHKQALDAIKHSGGQIQLVVSRPPLGAAIVTPLSPPIITQRPKAPSLQISLQQKIRKALEDESTPATHAFVQNRLERLHGIVEFSSPNPPYRPIHITTNNNRDPYQNHTMPMQNSIHKLPPSTSHTNYYNQQPPSPQFQPPRRQRDTYSQPPFQSPTTPTTPPPPWATRQAAPKRVTKLSQLGGGGFSFGTNYCTLPRRGTRQSWAYYGESRPALDRKTPEREENDGEPERLATGPVPKVCNLSNLGGGGYLFGSGYGSSATLPRRNVGRRLSQPPSMPSGGSYGFTPTKVTMNKFGGGAPQFGTDFYGRPSTTPAQRYEPQSDKGVMLNKVQSSLDNITLSPRTPEPYQGSPFAPQYPSQPSPQQVYTPTGLLLEQQRLEEERRRQQQQQQLQQQQQYEPQYEPRQYQPEPQQYQPQPQQYQPSPYQDELEEGEVIVPVWERRKQFQQGAPQQASVRTPRNKPPPKVPKPRPGPSSYNDFGTSYNKPAQKQSIAMWQPSSPQPKPVTTPVAPYSPAPVHVTPVNVEPPVKSTPPSWQRPQDDDDEADAVPAWRHTLRSTGVKPWDTDVTYSPTQHAVRSVPYNPAPYQNTIEQYSPSKGPVTPVGDDKTDGPKVVHLQYNSPMGLYSNDNVAETLRGQTSCLSGQSKNPQTNLPGERDWSQSAVLRFIEQEGNKKPKGKAPPATAPKPTVHHQPQQQQQQPYYADVGVSDF